MKTDTNQTDRPDEGVIERLFQVGAHFGYSKRRRHPSISDHIFGVKNKVEIIDLEKTSSQLVAAQAFMKERGEAGMQVLFVGGKNEAREPVKESAMALGMPYVAGRWIGGTLTNFSEIRKRVERLEDLTEKRDKGELESKYTKHERLLLEREIENLSKMFGGIISMKALPSALLVVDTKHEKTAVSEARRLGIPIVGLLNSDSDMMAAAYPIVANDASRKSITFFVTELSNAYRKGREEKEKEQGLQP